MKSIKFDIVRAEQNHFVMWKSERTKKKSFQILRTWYLQCNSFRITVQTDPCLMCAVFGRQKNAIFFLLACCYRMSLLRFSFQIESMALRFLFISTDRDSRSLARSPIVLSSILNNRSLFVKSTFSLSHFWRWSSRDSVAFIYILYTRSYRFVYLWFVINFSYIRYILLLGRILFSTFCSNAFLHYEPFLFSFHSSPSSPHHHQRRRRRLPVLPAMMYILRI